MILDPYQKVFTWDIKSKMMGRRELEAAKFLIEATGIPLSPEEYISQKNAIHAKLMPTCRPLPGVMRLLKHLKKHNIPIAIATSSLKDAFDVKNQHNQEMVDCFDGHIVVGDDPRVNASKPAPDSFLAAAATLNVDPTSCLVFEDAPMGVEAGLNAGCGVVWIPDVNLEKDLTLVARCNKVLLSMEEFRPEEFDVPMVSPPTKIEFSRICRKIEDSSMQQELIVPFSNLKNAIIQIATLPALDDGHIRLRIDSFSVTANNITYVALGKSFQYKDFFPTSLPEDTMKMPVWGVATVIDSKHESILVGEILYGYFPTAAYVDMKPKSVSPTVIRVQRDQLPKDRAVYNEYMRASKDLLYHPKTVDIMITFRPLFGTSFYLGDFLVENKFFGADRIIITSASSKTAFCLAQLLTNGFYNAAGKEVVGLTSTGNKSFVEKLGVYNTVVEYKDASTLLSSSTGVIVDLAGNADTNNSIVGTNIKNLRGIIAVGMSHYDPAKESAGMKRELQAQTKFFFAPAWIQQRLKELGSAEMGSRMGKAWKLLLGKVNGWVQVKKAVGPEAILRLYLNMLDGKTPPNECCVASFHNQTAPKL
ncbi:hypothetical protein HDU97_002910 [Phlyctochytrium planicorne]|nr:hypothetical protein HDU97_002910 [Phlyctochytrium planicorne]